MSANRCSAKWEEDSRTVACRFETVWRRLRKLHNEGKLKIEPNLSNRWTLDRYGLCLLHSEDKDWKEQQGFQDFLKIFIKGWDAAIFRQLVADKYLSFQRCVFSATSEDKELESEKVLNLTELKLRSPVLFERCRFEELTWFGYSRFTRAITFAQCVFGRDVDFGSAEFEQRLQFRNCIVVGDLSFRGAKFAVGGDFDHLTASIVTFNDVSFGYHLSLVNSSVQKAYIIKCMSLFQDTGSWVNLGGMKAGELHMEACRFAGEVSFEGVDLLDGEVIDTVFPSNKVVSFDSIRVGSVLHIKSRDPKRKTFSHAVSLRIQSPQDVPGNIIFENANVFHLKLNDHAMALRRARPARIVFGPGCDPYRLKKEITVPASPEWMELVNEVGSTFGAFFRLHRPEMFELKVECEYGETSALIRYYADANIEEDEFLRLLSVAAPCFVNFLRDPSGLTRELLVRTEALTEKAASWKIKVFDLYRTALSLLSGMAVRAQFDSRWKLDDTCTMLWIASEQPPRRTTVEFHQHITQIALFSRAEQVAAGRDANLLTNGAARTGDLSDED